MNAVDANQDGAEPADIDQVRSDTLIPWTGRELDATVTRHALEDSLAI